MKYWLCAWALLFSLTSNAHELILIMDDMGNNRALGERALALPGPINFAFLPHTPFAKRLAQQAYQAQHGVMLHLPMDNQRHFPLGPGGLYASMSKDQLQQTILDNLKSIPHVQGINNHTGSLLTELKEPMQWTMEVARAQELFFVDSFTTAQSIAAQEAKRAGVPNLKRDIFLDNDTSDTALNQQFQQALERVKTQGYAVLIAHPYPQTLNFLQQHLPKLPEQGIKLQSAASFLQPPSWDSFALPEPLFTKYQLD